jgi:quinone-reactive Ni/Fe-hydrogenase small subunit/[NiFe] hydrogenase small subunit
MSSKSQKATRSLLGKIHTMSKGGNMKGSDDYSKAVSNHYKQLMEYCKINQERLDRELPPPREDLNDLLAERGVSRRDFIKWTSVMTSLLMLPPMFRPALATAAENFSRLPIAWLHFAECTGCTEAFLRTSYPNVADIVLETASD